MKSLIKIYSKYIGATWAIILLLLMANMAFLLWVEIGRAHV